MVNRRSILPDNGPPILRIKLVVLPYMYTYMCMCVCVCTIISQSSFPNGKRVTHVYTHVARRVARDREGCVLFSLSHPSAGIPRVSQHQLAASAGTRRTFASRHPGVRGGSRPEKDPRRPLHQAARRAARRFERIVSWPRGDRRPRICAADESTLRF